MIKRKRTYSFHNDWALAKISHEEKLGYFTTYMAILH